MSASAAESIMTTKRHFFTRIFPFWATQTAMAAEAGFFPANGVVVSPPGEFLHRREGGPTGFAPEMCVVVGTEALLANNSMIRFISSLQTYLNSL